MTLNIGTLPGDTLAELSNYIRETANELAAEAASFIDDVVAQREIDFSQVGDLDSLNYLQWDYNTELNQLFALRAGTVALGDVSPDIDRILAVPVPASPSLTLPTATIPSLDAERPVISLPALPGTDVGLAPSDAPAITDISTPDAPLVTLPNVPTFEELQLPVAPSYVLPSFSETAPQNLLVAPTAQFAYVDTGYTSALRDPLVAKLLFDLENGGYGIDANDELALWTRARDRAGQVGRTGMEEAQRRAYDMSFPLPQGALIAGMEQAQKDLLAEISKANLEIALKRSDLYVENRKFTITQVNELEKVSIALYNAIQERSLNAAKATVELGIAAFDSTVRNFNAQLESYKTSASVFETLMRAELQKAELYKAQIQAEALRGEFNKQKADLYQAQLNGINSVVNLYKTRVEATAALTNVQAQKIEIFKSRVQAYAERVRAKASEYDMYRAAVQGETAKLEIYKTDIAAYNARLTGEEVRTRVLMQGNAALIQQYEAAVKQYEETLKAADAALKARLDEQRTDVLAAQVNVSGYRALTDAVLAGVQQKVASQKMNNDWNIAALNSNVDAVKMRLEQLRLTVQSRTEIDKFGAKFFMDPLTATLASLNGLSVKSE